MTAENLGWCEDPSNKDTRYERIRVRKVLDSLRPLGLDARVLTEVAGNMERAREALDWYTFLAAKDLALIDAGDVLLDLRGFRTLPEEIARRLLLHVVGWISGDRYPPRRAAVAEAMAAIRHERSAQLGGCLILNQGRRARICREYKAVETSRVQIGELWDGRWVLSGAVLPEAEIRPLGPQGLSHCPNWRETGRPHAALQATPAIWQGESLVAAPLAGEPRGWAARLESGEEDFYASLLSH